MEFKKIIDRIKNKTGYTQKDIASLLFGISDKNLSNKIRRNSVDLDALIKWAGNESVDLNWLLTGEGEPHLYRGVDHPGIQEPEGRVAEAIQDCNPNVVELQHMELVRMFNDKLRAKNANLDLLQIENLDRDTFLEVVGYIKGMATNLKLNAERNTYTIPDRRQGERRMEEDHGQIPKGQDRRGGKGRRKMANSAR